MQGINVNMCPNCFLEKSETVCEHCGFDERKMYKSSTALPVFTILNARYLLGRLLGQGGFGITYLAKDLVTEKLVAIKEYLPSELAQRNSDDTVSVTLPANQEFFDESKASFNLEAKTLSELGDNSFVVNVINYFSENNTEYFVMEFLDGVNLKVFLRTHNLKLSYSDSMYILLTIGSALMEIHKMGILHRDISPENIMMNSDGSIKLIDFGASRNYLRNGGQNMPVLYKPGFAPPEQYSHNKKQGPWSDIYALAATFYYIVSGTLVQEARERCDHDRVVPLKDMNCGVPDYVSDIIQKALALDYTERYTSVRQLLDDLSSVVNDINGIDDQVVGLVEKSRNIEIQGHSYINNIHKKSYRPFVRVLTGSNTGLKKEIPENDVLTIGRNETCDISINDSVEISRNHCKVGYNAENNLFSVLDISSNGTYFENLNRMPYNAMVYLKPNQSFYICSDIILELTVEEVSSN